MKTVKTIFLYVVITSFVFITVESYTQDYHEAVKLQASDIDAYDLFGKTVSISGNFAIVGAEFEDEDASGGNPLWGAGSVYIFQRDASGNWNEIQKIVASDREEYDHFGYSVAISGNHAIVGVPNEDHNATGGNNLDAAGSAYIFERDVYGNWFQVQKIVASDRGEEDYFGYSVSVSGNFIIVGALAECDDASGNNPLFRAGSSYIFERDLIGHWNEVQKIVASNRHEEDFFGGSVDISGNYAIVGASYNSEDAAGGNYLHSAGSAYIFERDGSGIWNQVQKIVASDRASSDIFGSSLSISGRYAVVSAYLQDQDAAGGNYQNNAGAAYIFERNNSGNWSEVQKIIASDRSSNDLFGYSVCIAGHSIVVGALGEDEDAAGSNFLFDAGSAYVFSRGSNGTWSEVQKIVASDRQAADFFGYSCGISGNYIITGTNYDDKKAAGEKLPDLENEGAAYIFEACSSSNASDPDNIIENGNFGACILSPWSVLGNLQAGVGCDAVVFNGICDVLIFNPSASSEHWHAQLNQVLTTAQINRLEQDATYILSFDAFARENKTFRLSFEKNGDPWTPLLDVTISLTTDPQFYTFEFVAHTIFSEMKLSLQVGIDASPVTFDNVRLVKKATPNLDDPERADCIRIFPNPVSNKLRIDAEKLSEKRIYNAVGSLVKTVLTANKPEVIDVTDLTEGMYILVVSHENIIAVRKIIIDR